MTTIRFEGHLEKINKAVFGACKNLKEIVFSEDLQEIGDEAFSECGLEMVTIPPSVKVIGNKAFYKSEKLKKVELSESLQIGLYDSSRMYMFVPLITPQAWIWNTTLDEIYRAAVRNIQDRRPGKADGQELIRRLLPQYFY